MSSNALAFGSSTMQLALGVTNVGGGALGASVMTSTTDGMPWLSTNVLPAGGGTLTVSVDRTGLANGSYSGQVAISSAGGNANVAVSMSVTSTGGMELFLDVGDVFVVAVDIADLVTVAGDTADGEGDFFLDPVPSGTWLLAAGPDLDNDGFICGIGEPCGLFPVLNDPVLVTVPDNTLVTNVNFPVVDAVALPSSGGVGFAIPPRGFPLPAQGKQQP